ncbi:MAG TPA: YihY/virulence factor BrkB family protein [Thermoanaerobaculia bacterium]|nr:YihY/virulence factor BrkB family protein [Thermoanaerobaculia bacterium]
MNEARPGAIELLKEAFREFNEDRAPRVAAALAYYTIFSLAPLLLVLVAVGSIVWGEEAARGEVLVAAREFVGEAGAGAVQQMLSNSVDREAGRIALIVGIVGLILGASTASSHLKESLNIIWDLPPRRKEGILGTVRIRFFSLAVVLTIGLLLLTSLVVSAGVAAVGRNVTDRLRGGQFMWQVLDVVLSVAVITLLFALLFKYLPDRRIDWRHVWTGAFFTALLFVIGKLGLALWIGRGSFESTYGAAASFLILLVWIYYSSVIFFFGAEFTQVQSGAEEKGRGRTPHGES